MEEKKREYRMYFLTMRNISEIQKGIQCGHAAIEYSLKYQNDPIYQDWAKNHKTFVILNGGTSNEGISYEMGSMEQHLLVLKNANIKHAAFYEPDLNWSLSAIAFILDERVFNKHLYPDYHIWLSTMYPKELFFNNEDKEYYQEWLNFIGGEEIAWLRDFKDKFHLA